MCDSISQFFLDHEKIFLVNRVAALQLDELISIQGFSFILILLVIATHSKKSRVFFKQANENATKFLRSKILSINLRIKAIKFFYPLGVLAQRKRRKNMIFQKEYLDLVLVPSGLLIMFVYHLLLLYRCLRLPHTTVIGFENIDKKVWVEKIMQVREILLYLTVIFIH